MMHNWCRDLPTLKQFHATLIVTLLMPPTSNFASHQLISLYAKFGDIDSALLLVNASRERNTSTHLWNSIIKAHVNSDLPSLAFSLYKQMREKCIPHDGFTFPIINKLILSPQVSSISYGEMIHCLAIRMGFEWNLYFRNTMLEAYGKCGCLGNARQLFDEMSERDLISWTSMVSAYISQRNVVGAFMLFRRMQMVIEPNFVTLIVMFGACSICTHASVIEGRQLHGYVIKKGFIIDKAVQNSVLKMYTTNNTLDDADFLFTEMEERDIVSWNIMISSLCSRKKVCEVADCFREMIGDLTPNIATFTSLISLFAETGNFIQGKEIHCFAQKSGSCDNIITTSLIDLYAKCGELGKSKQLFREIPHRNIITWNAMLSGFIHNGHYKEAVELFQQMLVTGLVPAAETLESIIISCSHMGALRLGQAVHGYLIRNSFYDSKVEHKTLKTSILNMYIRCGCLSATRICFDLIAEKDLVTWTSMIEGYGIHGLGFEALHLFHRMVEEGVKPNSVTFLSLLSACSHSGLLYEGCEIFYLMEHRFSIQPHLNHYTSIVDLLGRCGKIKEAMAVIIKLVDCPDSRIWGALLASCRVHEDQKHGVYAAGRILELEPDNFGYNTMLSNVQASVGRWDKVEEIRIAMNEKNLWKKPGWSCIEAHGSIHYFVAGDRLHQPYDDISELLKYLSYEMQDLGYGVYRSTRDL